MCKDLTLCKVIHLSVEDADHLMFWKQALATFDRHATLSMSSLSCLRQ